MISKKSSIILKKIKDELKKVFSTFVNVVNGIFYTKGKRYRLKTPARIFLYTIVLSTIGVLMVNATNFDSVNKEDKLNLQITSKSYLEEKLSTISWSNENFDITPINDENELVEDNYTEIAYIALDNIYLNENLTLLANRHNIRSVTYMFYTKITNRTAPQYHLLNTMNLVSYTDDGFVKIGEYYAVALGSSFGPIGSKFIIETDEGEEIKIIKADRKSDNHTVNGFAQKNDHSIVEFLLNPNNEFIKELRAKGGNVAARINSHCRGVFSGNISNIYNVVDDGLIDLIMEANRNYNRI